MRALKRLCRQRGLLLLVAADARLARAIGADGLHLPESLVAAPGWQRFKRPGWLVTAAAHSGAAIARAFSHGADAVLVSPVFPTASHPGGPALGLLRFARLARAKPAAGLRPGRDQRRDPASAQRLANRRDCRDQRRCRHQASSP